MVLRSTLISCLCLIPCCSTLAQDASPADQDLLAKSMKESGLIYTDIGRFYRLKFNYKESGRQQYSFLRKRGDQYRSLSVQEAYSMVYESKTAPSSEVTEKVFQKVLTIGGFILEEPGENQEYWRIRFRIEVPTQSTPERVKAYISIVAGTADQIEQELNKVDEL